uniref:Uncharacterized protein n=1 Tax=Oncorhynchus tshawytscha TaxID=74940 RepID=A0A8C8ELC4_ONCTS
MSYVLSSNTGALSLLSRTRIVISAVPDLAGFPPSTAVKSRLCTDCFSLEVFSTSSGFFWPPWVFMFNRKWSLSLIL